MDLDALAVEQVARRLGDPSRQTGQDAISGLDQHDADVALRIDAIEPVRDHFARGAVQLGSQFGARRAGADDRYMKLAGTYRAILRLSTNARIHEAAIEARRLGRSTSVQIRLSAGYS
jgi:hypothetical protein